MKNKLTVALMLFGVFGVALVALAQTPDVTPQIFGIGSTVLALALGLVSSVLISVFKKGHYSDKQKYAITYAVSFAFTIGAWFYAKQYVGVEISKNIGVVFLAISGAAQLVFVFLQNKVLKPIETTVKPGKVSAPPA